MPRRPILRDGGTVAETHGRPVAQQLVTLDRDLDRVRDWLKSQPPDMLVDVYVEMDANTCTLSFERTPPA
jgi:hypothetical protein